MLDRSIELIDALQRANYNIMNGVDDEIKLNNIFDINATQALLLYKLSKVPAITPSDAKRKKMYYGSNISYNINKLVQNGYLVRQFNEHDKRVVAVATTDKGNSFSLIFEDILKSKDYYSVKKELLKALLPTTGSPNLWVGDESAENQQII